MQENSNKATSRQLWALFCGLRVDCRNVELSMTEASGFIKMAQTNPTLAKEKLMELGAIDKGGNARPTKAQTDYKSIYNEAHLAGHAAANSHTPTPMVVSQHESPINDASPVVKSYYVSQGICGFYSVVIRPATCGFVKWLKANNLGGYKHYYGGHNLPCHEFNQSYELKEKYCTAFAAVLAKHGIKAYADGRLD